MSKLSSQLEAFCRRYVIDFNHVVAAEVSGCSADVINDPIIIQRVGELLIPRTIRNRSDGKFSQEILDEICDRLGEGEFLTEIYRSDKGKFPTPSTVRDWMAADPVIARQVARARELGEDHLAAQCIPIADDGQNDWMDKNDPDNAGYRANGEHIQRSKLRIWTRMELLKKMNPKKYGDRVSQELSGPDGTPLPPVTVTFVNPKG